MKNIAAILASFLLIGTTTLEANSTCNFSASMEYLYWKVQENQLYPALLFDQVKNSEVNVTNGTLLNQKFDYTSGFRAGLGVAFPCIGYDISLSWTQIQPRTAVGYSESNSAILIVFPYLFQTESDTPKARSLESEWRLDFDMFDLDLGCKFLIGQSFTLRPFIGVKGGWINQMQEMKVHDISLDQNFYAVAQGESQRKNDFSGIGPRMGFDLNYGIGKEFGLFGKISGALLYGKFDLINVISISETVDFDYIPKGPSIASLINSDHYFSPMTQGLVGANWTSTFCQKFVISLSVAYEVQFWWNQMRSLGSIPQALFLNSPAGGDLIMHGLTVQAQFEF